MSKNITERLYYKEPHLYECTARVLSCEKTDAGFSVVLDRTVFFPEGGGQPSDAGTIAGEPVITAEDCSERIVYTLSREFTVGEEVTVAIDRDRRLDHSQQHTGEHMLSGTLKRCFNASNVGFHMSAEYSTIDIDKELSDEELSLLELTVNRAITANEPVYIEIVEPDALSEIALRKDTSKLESGDEPVRIVYIGEKGAIDACACCGTHTAMTGEVGVLSITASKRHRGGTRIWFLCGERAVQDAMKRRLELDEIANMFSTGHEEAVSVVRKLSEEYGALKRELRMAQAELAAIRAKELIAAADEVSGVKIIVTKTKGGASEAKQLIEKLTLACAEEKLKMTASVFATDGERLYYSIGCTDSVTPDASEACNVINTLFNGRGGGRGGLAQGSAAFVSESQLEQSMEALEQYLKKSVK